MTNDELKHWMASESVSVRGLAALLSELTLRPVAPSTVQHWRDGTYRVPRWLPDVLRRLETE